ncbi:hypothetical protein [Oceanibacterium hippocampi]|uniref:Lipoprotein n=1 Tax=Oceanibacterium hippocampi TaxID=745714 RepID=A0A1Y5S4Z6_9PROT|nr:hypothetical protein [Oceanibacterium hippocampi]SLN31443.1 hypothetical protein OCH7691_01126 [Oceanibacterium hippocampi]
MRFPPALAVMALLLALAGCTTPNTELPPDQPLSLAADKTYMLIAVLHRWHGALTFCEAGQGGRHFEVGVNATGDELCGGGAIFTLSPRSVALDHSSFSIRPGESFEVHEGRYGFTYYVIETDPGRFYPARTFRRRSVVIMSGSAPVFTLKPGRINYVGHFAQSPKGSLRPLAFMPEAARAGLATRTPKDGSLPMHASRPDISDVTCKEETQGLAPFFNENIIVCDIGVPRPIPDMQERIAGRF